MSNPYQYLDEHLTEVTSQPDQSLDVFAVDGFIPVVNVAPEKSAGKIVVDRALLGINLTGKALGRAGEADHPSINLGAPSTVSYETVEAASPKIAIDVKQWRRTLDPIKYEERKARAVVKTTRMKVYSDVYTKLTAAASSTNRVNLVDIVGGSGNQLQDYVDGDLVRDCMGLVELHMKQNGFTAPKHLVLNQTAIWHGIRQAKVKADLSNDSDRKIVGQELADLISLKTGCEVHVQRAAANNALIWGAEIVLLPDHDIGQVITADGAEIDPCAAALIVEDIPGIAGMHYVKRWEKADGNVIYIAAPCSYAAVSVDTAALTQAVSAYA